MGSENHLNPTLLEGKKQLKTIKRSEILKPGRDFVIIFVVLGTVDMETQLTSDR